MKHLLIVYHSQSGNTERLANAVLAGAIAAEVEAVRLRVRLALEARPSDLLWADALVIGSPENFGYMSGGIKVFFERTFYTCEGQVQSLPYALVISAGNDGTGAVSSIRRIARGYPLREVQAPIVVKGEVTEAALAECEALGGAVAAGLELGIF